MHMSYICLGLLHLISSVTVPQNVFVVDSIFSFKIWLEGDSVAFFIEMHREGFLGMGFALGMQAGVAFLIQFTGDTPYISDCVFQGYTRPLCSQPKSPIYQLSQFEFTMSGYKALVKTDIKNNFNVPVTRGENTFSFSYGFTPKLTYHDLTAGSRGRLVLSISESNEDPTNNSTNPSVPGVPSGGTDESGSSPTPGQSQAGNSTNQTQTGANSTQNASDSTTNNTSSPHPPTSTNSSQKGRIKVVNPSTYRPKRYTLSEDLTCFSLLLVVAWVTVHP